MAIFKLPFLATSDIKQVVAIRGNLVKQNIVKTAKSDLSSPWKLLS